MTRYETKITKTTFTLYDPNEDDSQKGLAWWVLAVYVLVFGFVALWNWYHFGSIAP